METIKKYRSSEWQNEKGETVIVESFQDKRGFYWTSKILNNNKSKIRDYWDLKRLMAWRGYQRISY